MIQRLATHAMATRFELALEGREGSVLTAVGEFALEEIRDCEWRLSRFDPGSLIALVNREAHERPVALDGDTFELLELCLEVQRASKGAFDPTAGALLESFGPSPGARDVPRRTGAGLVALDARGSSVGFLFPGVELDLGAIGKGHALALAASVLREHGVERGLLHGGTSTVVGIGTPAFRVALRGSELCARLRDSALSVSAPHGREFVHEGRRVGHVIDPLRSRPAEGVRFAAVIHPDARLADAWSTALVAGAALEDLPKESRAVLQRSDGALYEHTGIHADAGSDFEPLLATS